MPNPVLHHVTVRTCRLQEMIDWYSTVIGARVMFQNEGAAWLSNDGSNHRFALLAFPGLEDDPARNDHVGMHHSAYEFASFGELIDAYARLRGEGIEPAFCLDHGMTFSMYYSDPDANYVELQADVFGNWDASSEFVLRSPQFAENPIGTFVDVARLAADHEGGTGFAELHRRAYAGEYTPDPIPDIGLPTPR
jgi:catechol-2,3-dioxygenase